MYYYFSPWKPPILPKKMMAAFPFSVESLCCRFSDAHYTNLPLAYRVCTAKLRETLASAGSCYSQDENCPVDD